MAEAVAAAEAVHQLLLHVQPLADRLHVLLQLHVLHPLHADQLHAVADAIQAAAAVVVCLAADSSDQVS